MGKLNTKKPNFFILGAPKCGTTSFAHWLSEHPEVYMASVKEPHYYNFDHNYHWTTSKQEYYSLFGEADKTVEAIGEASVWYLYSKEAIKNIEQDIKKPKYIVMLRNPVEMAKSLHQQLVFSGEENIKNFKEAWFATSDRKKGKKIPALCREPEFLYYDDACRLGQQLERLFSLVGTDRVKVILLDDIKEDPKNCYKETLDFLSLNYHNKNDFPVVNKATIRKSPLLKTLVQMYKIARRKLKIPRLNTGFIAKIENLNSTEKKKNQKNELDSSLKDFFKEDIEKLEDLIKRDLAHWKE